MRIAVGGFLHESHSFAPRPTGWEEFLHPGGFPPLSRGTAMPDAVRGGSNSIAGILRALEEAGAEPVPTLWTLANPAGPVRDAAFERIAAMLCAGLSEALEAGPLDSVALDLHGAMLADSFPDAEGELLRRVRRIVGELPVVATLDPHANLTRQMVEESDALVPYRTYPHVDMVDTGRRAVALLIRRIAHGAPFAKAFRQLDYWMAITSQCTTMPPMQPVMAERAAIAERHGAAELAWCFGFPYADFADCGAACAAYTADQATADAAADELIRHLRAHEGDFVLDVAPAEDAVADALRTVRLGSGRPGPVVIADTQDNPGGGGHGDTTGLLAELVRQGARGAVLCLLNDPDSAAACHAAGSGAVLDLALGGRSDGAPFRARCRVTGLASGAFSMTGPMSRGNPANLGPMAVVDIEPGIRVVLASRKVQAYDQAILRHVGIEPADQPILVLKSSVHFRADFAPIAGRIIVAAAPGPVVADPATLPLRHVRPGVRRRPGDNRPG